MLGINNSMISEGCEINEKITSLIPILGIVVGRGAEVYKSKLCKIQQ